MTKEMEQLKIKLDYLGYKGINIETVKVEIDDGILLFPVPGLFQDLLTPGSVCKTRKFILICQFFKLILLAFIHPAGVKIQQIRKQQH